jgi:hypothetical protein
MQCRTFFLSSVFFLAEPTMITSDHRLHRVLCTTCLKSTQSCIKHTQQSKKFALERWCEALRRTWRWPTFRFLKRKPFVFWRWSKRRPGVATRKFTPLASFSASVRLLAPPITMPCVCLWYFRISLATPYICNLVILQHVKWRSVEWTRDSMKASKPTICLKSSSSRWK